MDRQTIVATALSAGLILTVRAAGAEPEDVAPHDADPTAADAELDPLAGGARWLRFKAGQVELDFELSELSLSDDVVVQVDRYRLTSDALRLRRGPRGIEVEGGGRLAFCPCAGAPVTIGFEAATVAPPTDLYIEDPTIRVGGLPVCWLPALWLRAPDRVGMLPPYVAWRGDDGLLAGTGVHLPWGERDESGEVKSLDLSAGGYLEGGVEVDARLHTAQSTTRLRWDHLRESLLAADARGSVTDRDGEATAAWRVDAIRGPRGRRATLGLEEASRRYDRGEAIVGHYGDTLVAAVGLRADAPRGGGVDQLGVAGPRAHLGYAVALGSIAATDGMLGVQTSHDPDLGPATLVVHRRSIQLNGRPGPFVVGAELHNELLASSAAIEDGLGAWVHGRLRTGVPLVRAFGSGADPWRHTIEPFARVDLGRAAHRGVLIDPSWPVDGTQAAGVAGARTAFGRYGARQAGSLTATSGFVGSTDDLEPAVAGRARARFEWFGVGSDAVWLPDRPRGFLALVRTRLGPTDGLHLSGYAEGRRDFDFTLARWLAKDAALPLRADWLELPGWTAGAELGVPWARWLASSVSIDHDLSRERLLGVRGATAYRHPCGCLATAGWVGHRIGRPGVDVWVTVDLLP